MKIPNQEPYTYVDVHCGEPIRLHTNEGDIVITIEDTNEPEIHVVGIEFEAITAQSLKHLIHVRKN